MVTVDCPDLAVRPAFEGSTVSLIVQGYLLLGDIYCHVNSAQDVKSYLNLYAHNQAISDYDHVKGSQ